MTHKFLQFDVEAACRAAAQEMQQAGWEPHLTALPDAFPAGPTIYLCHYEAQYLVLVRLVIGGVEKMQSMSASNGITFQDACDTLGTVMDTLASGETSLDRSVRNVLTSASALYISGTRAYQLAKARDLDQFLVIRHSHASGREKMLRPVVSTLTTPLTPADVGDLVVKVLTGDRQVHPERFGGGQPIRFRPKPL